MFSTINPYIYGEQEEEKINVKSSVGRIVMESCDVAPKNDHYHHRRKRAAATVPKKSLQPSQPFTMTLKPKGLPNLQFVNITPVDAQNMVYHVFNLSENIKPVHINLYPLNGHILSVYIRISQMPHPENYTWNYTIPHNISALNISMKDSTIMITKEKLMSALAETSESNITLFIGITHKGNEMVHYFLFYLMVQCTTHDIFNCSTNTIIYFIMGIYIPGCTDPTHVCYETGDPIMYHIRILELSCQAWDDKSNMWSEMNCQVRKSMNQMH